jgi:hypothetical protein
VYLLGYYFLMLWHYILFTFLVVVGLGRALRPLVKRRLYRVGIAYYVSVMLRLVVSGGLLGFHHYLLPGIRPTFADLFSLALAFAVLKRWEDPPLY